MSVVIIAMSVVIIIMCVVRTIIFAQCAGGMFAPVTNVQGAGRTRMVRVTRVMRTRSMTMLTLTMFMMMMPAGEGW